MKGVIFVNGRYTKGVPFLSKMVHKKVKGFNGPRGPRGALWISSDRDDRRGSG